MSRKVLILAVLAGTAGAAIAALPRQQGSNPNLESATDETQATCRRLGTPRIPAADKPNAAERAALKGCDSEKLYYGFGAKPDYLKARQCAVIEAEGADAEVFGGSTILMQVYANGYGVKRNPDLATALACKIDAAPAEYDGRVAALQDLKTKPATIDYCDSITSGLAQGFCVDRDSRIAAVGRNARLTALIASFPPTGRAAYPTLKKAFDTFVDASADGETDQSGTGRGAFVVEAEDALRNQFLTDLQRLKGGTWPAASAADAADADAKLNASYKKALAAASGPDRYGTVTADYIRAAQRAWLPYRDAWIRFAAVAAPGVSRDAVFARITRLRLAQLDALVSE